MIPSIQHYLDAASRALQEVVAPAVDPSNSFAVEQLALVQGMLAIIGQQWPHAYALEAIELRELGQLAEQVSRLTTDRPETGDARAKTDSIMHQFGASHVGAQLPFAELRRLNVELRDLVETMIGAQPADHPTRTQVDQAVLDHAAREADRARAWFAGTRIDIHWNTLPTIEEALGKARQR